MRFDATDTFVAESDGYRLGAWREDREHLIIQIGDDDPYPDWQCNYALIALTFPQAREFARQLMALVEECERHP
jgi:hypothetical protein